MAGNAVAFWPLRRQRLDTHAMELNSLITSFGLTLILTGIAREGDGLQHRPLAPAAVQRASAACRRRVLTNVQLIVVVASVVLSVAVWWAIGRARTRTPCALAYLPEMTQMAGVNVHRLTRGAFSLCGALAGCAAVLLSMLLNAVDATFGTDILLQAIAITWCAKGSGRILGALAAGLLLGIVEDVGSLYSQAEAYPGTSLPSC